MHIWLLNSTALWAAHPLTTTHDLQLLADGKSALLSHSTAWQVCLQPHNDTTDSPAYLLLVKEGVPVRLNGQQPLSISVLQNRDEIALGAAYVYYSTEVLPHIVPFAQLPETIFCARCKSALMQGDSAVQCPACCLWYHEAAEQHCWSYAETCICSHPTKMDAFVWQPSPMR